MSCITHHSGCECYDKEFAQTKAEAARLAQEVERYKRALEQCKNQRDDLYYFLTNDHGEDRAQDDAEIQAILDATK